jgi:hypothetical protein
MLADGTWIFLLEALLALVLAVLIVWWTLPRKSRGGREAGSGGDGRAPKEPPGH